MIKIICVGKLKEQYWKEALQEYQKRLQKYTKLEIIEIPDSMFDEVSKVLATESEKIAKYINEKDYVITLEIEGKMMDSILFAETMDKLEQQNPNLTFIIGGSYGLDFSIKKRANISFSFSKMTFPHQLFRVILLEQIYRSYRIRHHESYHK